MYEKVNPYHPDKVADRIAGAIGDIIYKNNPHARWAVEVLIGHGECNIIIETTATRQELQSEQVHEVVWRIAETEVYPRVHIVPQDAHLSDNQRREPRCGDNGIFKGVPVTREQQLLTDLVKEIAEENPSDGKYIILRDPIVTEGNAVFITACQSNAVSAMLHKGIEKYLHKHNGTDLGGYVLKKHLHAIHVNPLGEWTGGTDVDCGATNRKLGSDMGDAVTGGGLHGKDLTKADVSVNIACHLLAQQEQTEVKAACAIGDEEIIFNLSNGKQQVLRYANVVEMAREYIDSIGGFERLAEWGLIR